MFQDDEGTNYLIHDLIWQKWCDGELPSTIGEHGLELTIPSDWRQQVDGKVNPVRSVNFKFRVLGLVITITGQTSNHILINASDNAIEKSQVRASFDTSKTKYPVTTIFTEAQLGSIVSKPGAFNLIIGRQRLPRIHTGSIYWPPSERTGKLLLALMLAHKSGEIEELGPLDFGQIEGTDMRTIWEPIWAENPMVKRHNKKKN